MLLILLIICIVVSIVCLKFHRDKKYRDFVNEHSVAIQNLKKINEEFVFIDVPKMDMSHDYDNEKFYDNITPRDYLTYQLVYQARTVKEAIHSTALNRKKYVAYSSKIQQMCIFGIFDTQDKPKDEEKLLRTEKEVFDSIKRNPTISFSILVNLYLTNIKGNVRANKKSIFDENEIQEIMEKLSHKIDGFYLDDGIWQSICRVERGRVSNKMRFAIYERDGYRCRKCHRSGQFTDLEIDHIFPISKGGKSEFDNLQTLCHRCNTEKSNTVERGAVNPKARWQGVNVTCDVCGAPMVLKRGKYGDFYGCSNYPQCRFTKQK